MRLSEQKVPVQSLIDHIKTAVDVDPWAKEMAEELLKEQEPKTGHWVISEYEYLDCSCCGESYYTGANSTEEARQMLANGKYYKFCPYCGAKMTDRR